MVVTSEKISKYKAELKVKGPLFIGSGKTIEKSEYIAENKMIYVMDSLKMFKGLKEKRLLEKFQNDIIFWGSNFNMTNFVCKNKIKKSEYENWAAYNYNNESDSKITQVQAFIKDPYNMLYVPGSSIKGALRTAYENYYFSMYNTEEKCIKIKSALSERNYKTELNRKYKEASSDVFNKLKMKNTKSDAINDIFRGIRISDSKPISVENLILCGKYDKKPKLRGGKAKFINIQRECIKPGTIIEFSIEIIPEYFKIKKDENESFENAIYNIINRAQIMQKKYFLSKFSDIDNVSKNLIYIGGGSGFVSKTILHSVFKNERECAEVISRIIEKNKYKNAKNKCKNENDYREYGVSPHMRKCTLYKNNYYDFGLCELTMIPIE